MVSLWVLGLDLFQVLVHGRVWTGTDGVYLIDQLQYLAWIRDASRHLLVSNLFVLRSTPAVYLQPAIAISAGLSALGIAPWLSLLAWKPVAVLGCFESVRRYVARLLPERRSRHAALVLALFFGSFTVVYGSAGAIGDLYVGFLSWGYTFALLALAAMVGALLAYERSLQAAGGGWTAGLLGATASWLHPWNGTLLIVVVASAELLEWRGRRPRTARIARPALTIALTAMPLAYYAALSRADLSWQLARVASKHTFSIWSILLAIAPLLLVALPAYRRSPRGFLATATRIWPAAAVAVYALAGSSLGATPLHAFQGITIPLAVLSVESLRRVKPGGVRHPILWSSLAIAAFTVPATAYELSNARTLVAPKSGSANFITPDERRALDFVARDRAPGGVISRSYLGALVPAATGRRTFVGDCLWSQPHCDQRLVTVRTLFSGSLAPDAARRFVRASGARFLLADCRPNADLRRLLGPIVRTVRTFGCARVYVLG